MKELHNHIFSNTTCISKETMLRYINKQLSKSELHDVEKHMLDCELCSDAFAGMQYAENSSMLFAIDNQIDKRVAGGNTKAPIMRNLMVAASVLAIVFGTYSVLNFFNNTINTESNLAINKIEEIKNKDEFSSVQEPIFVNDFEENNTEIADIEKETEIQLTEKKSLSDNKNRMVKSVPVPVVEDQVVDEDVEVEQEMIELDEVEEFVVEKPIIEVATVRSAPLNPAIQSADESIKIAQGKALSKQKKRRFKSNISAKSNRKDEVKIVAKELRDKNQENIIIIESYKVVDYLAEYQQEYDLENAAKIETKSVSAVFENEEDKKVIEKAKEEAIVEITYKATLEKAIKLYKNQNYTQSISEFDVILTKHPEEVNALFYGAMSHYHLKRYSAAKNKFDLVLKNEATQFNEEANWYKALTLIELKENVKAKKLLKSIIQNRGFYKTKAVELLEDF